MLHEKTYECNAKPFVVLMPMALPKIGNRIAASTLKKNMTEIACATSSSSASMTGAVAATAEANTQLGKDIKKTAENICDFQKFAASCRPC